MEEFKKFSEDLKKEISEKIKSKEFQELITKIKSAENGGTFEVVVSTQDQDRQGEVVDQAGWDLSFYKMNPVVLWAHDYFSLPIGLTEEIEVKDGKLVAKGRFAPAEANPFAQQVRKLYDAGIVKTTSVGFIPRETDGQNIKKAELLEFSFVPVPANPYALSLRQIKEMSLDLGMLKMKGIEIKEEEKKTTKPEETEDYIRIPVKNADDYDPDSIHTITISAEQGIKALSACPKGEYEEGKCNVGVEIITYLFDKEKWTKEEAEKWIEEHKKKEKSGRVLSKKNRDLIAQSIAQLKDSIAALEELLKATEPQGDEGKTLPKQRSKSAGADDLTKSLESLNAYFETRQVLRLVTNSLTNSLEKINKKIRENSKR